MAQNFVDSYHINVGLGDSAIHVRRSITLQGTRYWAVLVDGGLQSSHSYVRIDRTMRQVEESLDLAEGGLKFAAVVITHWDRDHYGGISELLDHDDLYDSPKRFKHFLYDNLEFGTTFYAPYADTKLGIKISGPEDDAFMSFNGKKLAKARHGKHLIGRDIFTGESHANIQNSAIADLNELLGAQNNRLSVGMYCVAVNRFVVSGFLFQKTGFPPATAGREELLQTMHHDPTTATNQSSIATIIAWSNGRVSHYFAGDMHAWTECWIVSWLKQTTDKITCMKASHHGARTSNPPSMLWEFCPHNIVISAASKFGHPAWQYLMVIYAYTLIKNVQNTIFLTSYPFWVKVAVIKELFDEDKVNVDPLSFWDWEDIAKKPHGADRLAKAKRFTDMIKECYETHYDNSPFAKIYAELRSDFDNKISHWLPSEVFAKIAEEMFHISQELWNEYWESDKNLRYIHFTLTEDAQNDGSSEVGMRVAVPGQHSKTEEKKVRESVEKINVQIKKKIIRKSTIKGTDRTSQMKFGLFMNDQQQRRSQRVLEIQAKKKGLPIPPKKKGLKGVKGLQKMVANQVMFQQRVDQQQMAGIKVAAVSPSRKQLPAQPASQKSEASISGAGTAPAVIRTAATNDAKMPFSLFCSSQKDSTECFSRSDKYRVLLSTDPLDDFFFGLMDQAMHFVAPPQASPSWILLHPSDTIAMWLDLAIQATMEIDCSDTDVSAFKLRKGDFIFTTTVANATVGSAVATLSATGLSEWTDLGTMVFGLDESPASQSTFTTDEVLHMMPARKASPFEPAKLLSDLKWKLSATKGRQAIWFTPAADYLTVVRLQFEPAAENYSDKLSSFFKSFLDLDVKVSEVKLITRKCSSMAFDPDQQVQVSVERSTILSARITIEVEIDSNNQKTKVSISPRVTVELKSSGNMTLEIMTPDATSEFAKFFQVFQWWLLQKLGSKSSTDFGDLTSHDVAKSFSFRRLRVMIGPNAAGSTRILGAALAIEADAKLGSDETTHQVIPILLEAAYTSGGASSWSLHGGIWLKKPHYLPYDLFSDYEEVRIFEPTAENPAESLSLSKLFGKDPIKSPSTGIPDEITEADLSIDANEIIFSGTISGCSHELEDKGEVPVLNLKEVTVEAIIGLKPLQIDLSLRFRIGLELPDGEEGCASCSTDIRGAFQYSSGTKTWTMSAGLDNLNLGMLYGFFAEGYSGMLYELLKGIQIKNLEIKYERDKNEQALICSAQLILGEYVAVALDYRYLSGGYWAFNVEVKPSDQINSPVTLGMIMDSLLDKDNALVTDLPSFLKDSVILGPGADQPYFSLNIEKDPTKGGVKFLVKASIAGLEAQFLQMATKDDKDQVSTVRMFKASLKKIPMPKDVPLLEKLEQPFDELGFVWVNRELTKDETPALDSNVQFGDAGMKAGFHFIIIAKNKLVLDYPFSKSKKPDTKSDIALVKATDSGKQVEPSAPTTESKPAQSQKAKFKKTIGPLTISNIGFKYKDGTLSIIMDATFAFGPVALDLFGFALGLHFKGGQAVQGTDFFKNVDVGVSIDGLGIELNKPPLTISGAFIHEKDDDGSEYYAGGVALGFAPWLFQAAGFYGVVKLESKELKCFFMYVMLRGPIMTFEFAELSGLTAAFGYNVDLTMPRIDQVTTFPLLTPSTGNKTPRDTIRDLLPHGKDPSPYFNPLDGARWLAAGVTVTAFQMLEITSLVVVQWAPHVQLAILGLAICDIPSPKAPFKFAHIELGILATVDMQSGLFKFEAQLSPNSYILHESCHLTGGFAMYYWFKSGQSAVEGDWVCTIGGYHSAFAVPKHYPNPDRLKISWSVNNNLSIYGEAYFAITPKVCMGGVHIHAALNLGALSAWFDAYADFLINFAPFHFMAVGHVSVGIRFSMSVWFVTVNIAAEIGATLTLQGPPLGGNVHVDFWVFGFDIAFGIPSSADKEAISLEQFWRLVLQSDKPPKDAIQTPDKDVKPPHVFTCQQGLLADGDMDVKAEAPWSVRGGVLEFSISAYFAISSMNINGGKVDKPEKIDKVLAKPMQLTDEMKSNLDVDIMIGSNHSTGWKVTPIVKSMPEGMWGEYDLSNDPSRSSGTSDLLNPDGGTCRLVMGLQLEVPDPIVSKDTIPPFIVDKAMMENAFRKDDPQPKFPKHEKDSGAWLPLPDVGKDQWEHVSQAWKLPTADPKPTVDLFQTVFGVDKLSSKKPDVLIKYLDRLCLQAPLLGVEKFKFDVV